MCLLLLEKWKYELFFQQKAKKDEAVSKTQKDTIVILFENVMFTKILKTVKKRLGQNQH